ncbi:hypothetical protein M8J75_005866 [Diaphorina citri]|nr:hypothetical protein M8J75_005866 [Diaphorina citri]
MWHNGIRSQTMWHNGIRSQTMWHNGIRSQTMWHNGIGSQTMWHNGIRSQTMWHNGIRFQTRGIPPTQRPTYPQYGGWDSKSGPDLQTTFTAKSDYQVPTVSLAIPSHKVKYGISTVQIISGL